MNDETKLLGGVGSALLALGITPYAGILFTLAGFILLLIAVKQISDKHNDKNIFRNFLTGTILNLTGIAIALVAATSTLLNFSFVSDIDNLTALGIGTLIGISIALLTLYVALVISGLLFKRTFNSIGKLTNNDLFSLAGNLIFWGSLATIILLGGILIWVGWILIAIAFFTTETNKDMTETATIL